MSGYLGAILLNYIGHCSGPIKWVGIGELHGIIVAHQHGWVFECNIGESVRIFEWPTEMGMNLGVILVNHIAYCSGPLKWVGIWVQYW
jgi:hypothetical protein